MMANFKLLTDFGRS